MEVLTYFLTGIITYLGLGCGIGLAYIAKEELNDGRKYFILSQNIILPLIIFSFLYFLKVSLIIDITLLIISFICLYYFNNLKNDNFKKNFYYIYLILGIIFFISSKNNNFFIVESSLIFLYGFPTGSLIIDVKKNNFFEILLKTISFIFISIVLFLMF